MNCDILYKEGKSGRRRKYGNESESVALFCQTCRSRTLYKGSRRTVYGVPFPPSLVNIFKEIQNDLGKPIPCSGRLERWADQGVLLINAILTVRAHQAGSHQGKGWEEFTDAVIRRLNDEREHIVFMLWGAYAQKKGTFIDRTRHCVLTAPHPSPLSADRGFFGCKHFSKANAYFRSKGLAEIEW